MQVEGRNNEVITGKNVNLSGKIIGDNNKITIGNARSPSTLRIFMHGNNNQIEIHDSYQIKDLQINCGSHAAANNTILRIEKQFSIEPGCSFLLYNSGNSLSIGSDCLFSNGITIRCGESPHLVFDFDSGDYLDVSEGVHIGDHVWIGEHVYVTKRAGVASGSIVAACAVVTRSFAQNNVVLGGNPATVVKQRIHWVRNKDFLIKDSIFERAYRKHRVENP